MRLGRRAVDFVGQQNVGKDRARNKRPGAAAGGGVLFDDVGAGDVGRHQIGRELDALEHQPQRLRQGANQQRLGGSGQAGDQAVAADEQRDQHLLDHFVLADDHFADFADDAALWTSWKRSMRSFSSAESAMAVLELCLEWTCLFILQISKSNFCAGL